MVAKPPRLGPKANASRRQNAPCKACAGHDGDTRKDWLVMYWNHSIYIIYIYAYMRSHAHTDIYIYTSHIYIYMYISVCVCMRVFDFGGAFYNIDIGWSRSHRFCSNALVSFADLPAGHWGSGDSDDASGLWRGDARGKQQVKGQKKTIFKRRGCVKHGELLLVGDFGKIWNINQFFNSGCFLMVEIWPHDTFSYWLVVWKIFYFSICWVLPFEKKNQRGRSTTNQIINHH